MIDRYRVLAQLKEGGMATLYLCERTGAAGFQKHVAIKVVHQQLSADERFIQMFVDEALLTSRIEHPNVVHVEELGASDGKYFLVMEYVHGASLSQLLRALARSRRRMRPELAVAIAIAAADGLHAAHEMRGTDGEPLNVVHRDVSPENILISHSGYVKLIDFGVAKFRDRVSQTTIGGTLKGKVAYMAPEQARNLEVDRRADIYQLGIILWEMLTMRRCFKGEMSLAFLDRVRHPNIPPPCELALGISPGLDEAVMKALSADPNDRHGTAQEFRRALANAEPAALALDSSHLSELLAAMLADELEENRQSLPKDLNAAVEGPSFDEEEVLKTLTIDDVDLASAAEYAEEELESEPKKASDDTTPATPSRESQMLRARRASSQTFEAVQQAADQDAKLAEEPVPSWQGEYSATEQHGPIPERHSTGASPKRARLRNLVLGAVALALIVTIGLAYTEFTEPSWVLIKPKLPKVSAVQDLDLHIQSRAP